MTSTANKEKPLISVVLPAFNEASILKRNLQDLCNYMGTMEEEYQWEVVVVNDGSVDDTGNLAAAFAKSNENVHVVHHKRNCGLGQALQTGFQLCRGDYVVTLDIDLSYSPDHIPTLVNKIRESGAQMVLASPFMAGGRISNVPWVRLKTSVWANRFLSLVSGRTLETLTGMVRAYDGKFLKSLDLKSVSMEINPEVIYKGMVLRAHIEEIPAHLDWSLQRSEGAKRKSSMKMFRHTMAVFLSGFIFKPFMFFILPGLVLLVLALYVNGWMLIHFIRQFRVLSQHTWVFDRASAAIAAAYAQFPYTFIVGLITLMLAVQLISLGILALQNKKYFEEIFHLGTTIYKSALERQHKKPNG